MDPHGQLELELERLEEEAEIAEATAILSDSERDSAYFYAKARALRHEADRLASRIERKES